MHLFNVLVFNSYFPPPRLLRPRQRGVPDHLQDRHRLLGPVPPPAHGEPRSSHADGAQALLQLRPQPDPGRLVRRAAGVGGQGRRPVRVAHPQGGRGHSGPGQGDLAKVPEVHQGELDIYLFLNSN